MEERNLPSIVPPLLDWYDGHKRALPWRGERDPYGVWVSETMLQQTRVAAVIPYYRRWMEALPDVPALARAEEGRLMKLWEGLGYYSRARNLQRAARVIMSNWGGVFPRTFEGLLALPGVGDYTAGAVASIAFSQRVPAVDGNVLRVLSRLTELREDVTAPSVRRRVREAVGEIVPADRPGEFNQALMDLGAMVCLPRPRPLCGACPLRGLCAAFARGVQDQLPLRRRKAPRRVEELTVYLLFQDGRTALRRRAEGGLLGGLWEFPHVPGALGEAEAGAALEARGLRPVGWRRRQRAKHVFTHVEWRMTGYFVDVAGEAGDGLLWVPPAALEKLAVPAAFGKFLPEVRRVLEGP